MAEQGWAGKAAPLAGQVVGRAQAGRVPVQQPLEPGGEAEQGRVGADLGLRVDAVDGGAGQGVRPKQVAHDRADGLDLGLEGRVFGQAGRDVVVRLPPGLDVAQDEQRRLVQGNPVGNVGADCLGHAAGVLGEAGREAVGQQPAARFQVDGPGEVVQRDQRLHARRAYALRQSGVVVQGGRVPLAGRRLDARPGHREAEQAAAQPLSQGDVLRVALPEVRRPPARRQPPHPLPDVAHVLIFGDVGLALVVGGGDAEQEARREGGGAGWEQHCLLEQEFCYSPNFGGCFLMRMSRLLRLTTPGRFSCSASTVARPVGVNPMTRV